MFNTGSISSFDVGIKMFYSNLHTFIVDGLFFFTGRIKSNMRANCICLKSAGQPYFVKDLHSKGFNQNAL